MNNNERIGVVIQAIYGNRTFMMLQKDEIDMFILGCLDTAHFKKYYKKDKIDRTVVRLPGAEHLAE